MTEFEKTAIGSEELQKAVDLAALVRDKMPFADVSIHAFRPWFTQEGEYIAWRWVYICNGEVRVYGPSALDDLALVANMARETLAK